MSGDIFLIGAGDRGRTYTDWIRNRGRSLRVTAVAEPDAERRNRIMKDHRISPENCFSDWKDLFHSGLTCSGVIIATPDKLHIEPALAFMKRGVHILLEKPMAHCKEEVLLLWKAAVDCEKKGGSLTVCHVLRYSPFFLKIKEIIESGKIGTVQTMYHAENVGYYHMAHSFVRGNWRNSRTSSPIILAKSCHDLDIIFWLMNSKPVEISSMSGRTVFIAENAPPSAPERCSDGCAVSDSCLYEAEKTYLRGIPLKKALARSGSVPGAAARFMLSYKKLSARLPFFSKYYIWKEWPTSTITENLTEEGIGEALKTGPYGRCVYKCDNDQPEHQETVIRFESGATASFRLHGQSHEEGRTLRIDGSEGTLRAKFGNGSRISISVHGQIKDEIIPVKSDFLGHSRADTALMENWSTVLRGEKSRSSAGESFISHLMAFAAVESDKSGSAVSL